MQWEWIIVDDHSTDTTPTVIDELCKKDERVKSVRFSRNFGSHSAILAGLKFCSGDCVVVMASDLQDPPEFIPRLLDEWQKGNDVVWAVRKHRENISFMTSFLSQMYNRLLRGMSSLKDTPTKGADMWLMDRKVVRAVISDPELHTSIVALIRWMGFNQSTITYVKEARQFGKSKWSIAKKITHAINTFVASTVLPIRYMTYLGFLTSALGFLYAVVVLVNYFFFSNPSPGWTSLMIVLLIMGGLQMIMLGVLGEYLWRTYEESRQRPRYIIEKFINVDSKQ